MEFITENINQENILLNKLDEETLNVNQENILLNKLDEEAWHFNQENILLNKLNEKAWNVNQEHILLNKLDEETGLHCNAKKTEFKYYNTDAEIKITSKDGTYLELVQNFKYLGS